MRLLEPVITLYVHPVDTKAHPTVLPGWRWAVQVGGTAPHDVRYCANAGWELDRASASMAGEAVAAAAVRALQMFGCPVQYRMEWLDHDPIPAGADQITVG